MLSGVAYDAANHGVGFFRRGRWSGGLTSLVPKPQGELRVFEVVKNRIEVFRSSDLAHRELDPVPLEERLKELPLLTEGGGLEIRLGRQGVLKPKDQLKRARSRLMLKKDSNLIDAFWVGTTEDLAANRFVGGGIGYACGFRLRGRQHAKGDPR